MESGSEVFVEHQWGMERQIQEHSLSLDDASDNAGEESSEEDLDDDVILPGQLTRDQQQLILLIDGALSLNVRFLRSLRAATFKLKTQATSAGQASDTEPEPAAVYSALGLDFYVILNLGRDVGPGVTEDQFRHIMRCCRRCGHFCYKERQASHRCPGRRRTPWKGGPEELVAYLLSRVPNVGLSELDLRRQFASCGFCNNICMARRLALHKCRAAYNP
ncbi:hypothetical protein NMY22_g18993 [Coprinellus aureogranulatus]|nr:hypothetical protein NMY22_g18993 [Coprinellus aureogranulatus]